MYTAERCLAACTQARPHLLVTDLTLPDMDGGELIRRLRDAHPKLPILAISGASDDVLQSAWQNGADWVMRKPIVPVILLETAAYLIGGHVPQA